MKIKTNVKAGDTSTTTSGGATDASSSATPRDAATGQATGRRQYKPISFISGS